MTIITTKSKHCVPRCAKIGKVHISGKNHCPNPFEGLLEAEVFKVLQEGERKKLYNLSLVV